MTYLCGLAAWRESPHMPFASSHCKPNSRRMKPDPSWMKLDLPQMKLNLRRMKLDLSWMKLPQGQMKPPFIGCKAFVYKALREDDARKGAKAQRGTGFRMLLCVLAPLRETSIGVAP